MKFEEQLEVKCAQAQAIIKSYLPKEDGFCKTVEEAMNYSILAGGKRLRPILLQEAFLLFGGQGREVEPFMAAIEMIHTYSLVHDDLPCMDNDEFRRGRKTTHAVFGEGMAVLAGDALLNYAFETACQAFELTSDPERVARAMKVLAKKSGIYGMIGGQCADILAEDYKDEMITSELLLYIHEHKTAALIQNALMCGAILAGASQDEVNSMEKIGYNIGVAFQIQDDILDITGNEQELGKPVGSDEKNHKVTYVTLNGLGMAEKEVEELSIQAVSMLHSINEKDRFLEELILHLINRKK